MKHLFCLLALLVVVPVLGWAADDARSAFLNPPGRDIGAALKRATTEKKRVMVFTVDPARKQASHLEATMETPEAKQLVKDNFLVVIIPNRNEKHIAGMVDDVSPVHPAYVIFNPDGSVLEKGTAAMGAALGLQWVKKLADTPLPASAPGASTAPK